jgi:hypothetical protein
MKKIVFTLFLHILIVPCFPLFSLDLAAGGGAKITPYAEGIDMTAEGYKTAKLSYEWDEWAMYAFFDAKYVEFSLSYYRALTGVYKLVDFGDPLDFKTTYAISNISYLDLALMGRIPISMESAGVFYFFGGLAYKINLTSDYGYETFSGDYQKDSWNQMWIKIGSGYEFLFGRKLFARLALSLGFLLKNREWDSREKLMSDAFDEIAPGLGVNVNYSAIGPEFSFAIGYRIK